jgi:uncharacterized protein YegP (UPF0339 family)
VDAASRAIEKIYAPGNLLKKAGVLIIRLHPETIIQSHLWVSEDDWEKQKRLMKVIDAGNRKMINPNFVLRAGNGEVTGKSEMYSSVQTLANGISFVKANAPDAPTEDLT